jgi:hypothetical protein
VAYINTAIAGNVGSTPTSSTYGRSQRSAYAS